MTLSELRDVINLAIEHHNQYGSGREVVASIVVRVPGAIGGTPTVNVKNIQAGFDWDNGKLLIYPEKDLRTIEADEIIALRKYVEKEGWVEYENRGLKAEVKRLQKQLKERDEKNT